MGRYVTPKLRAGFADRLEYFGFGRAWAEALQSA